MERLTTTTLRIGAWRVDPASGEISRDGDTSRLDVRAMRLLVCLAERPGEVRSIEDLLAQVWSGVTVSSDSVYQAVASLRRLLGDDPKQPTYIETVPRLGYRMVAPVSSWTASPGGHANVQAGAASAVSRFSADEKSAPTPPLPSSKPHARPAFLWTAGAVVLLALIVASLFIGKRANNQHSAFAATVARPQKSIAVLPFLDLTAGMTEEEFADGMTEELIDKLSKIPGLRVPSPTSSFYFKGKLWPSHATPQLTVSDIAKALGVAYILDGSVRKSGAQVRVAARLVRADTGYVIWSETYDRPFHDLVMVQDDIAGEVTKALKASIEAGPDQPGSQ